ncbi:MAG TPA: glycoside hydrolase [Terriglobales bacterium]
MISNRRAFSLLAILIFVLNFAAVSQSIDPKLFHEMHWRSIGPYRGGRTVAISGIPSQPNVFYMAPNNGGVWKSTDYGDTWNPIFDDQPTGSIGALAIAPSDPNIIYVGSGEGLRRPDLSVGNGIYKSADAGRTWQHLGLRDGQQIGALIVDPHDPNRVFAAVLGHPYGPNDERGVFRSLDGGASWQKVLYKNADTGSIDLAFDPSNPQIVYANLWASRRPPWTTGGGLSAPGSGLFKSTDGGSTWNQLTKGLPEKVGRIGFGIAPSDPNRIYALVDAHGDSGVYRSDDAGASWSRVNTESRIWGRGEDFACVRVDPKNKDTIYIANTSTYRSTDAGKSFTAIKGAPGGDDYHTIWINPDNPQIIALAVDQGATISVNGGQTWSSWYNQPTAQFYHVITDNEFPYWVYGGQQESGSVGIASRSDFGSITFRDWYPIGVEEYGYAAPDPLDPNMIYGGKVTRFNRTTKQTQDVSPFVLRTGQFRFNRTAPLIFSPADPHTLFLGSNVLFKTTDGGNSWQIISPDLTRDDPGVPSTLNGFIDSDPAKGKHRGVIYSIAPSPKDAKLIWIGTDDGLIQVTRDGGKTWQNVSPPDLTPWSKLAQMDASHFDTSTVYAAVNRFRLDDLHPHIYRTHDGGKTWQQIVQGLPGDEPVNTVREDPERKGLLFAGTENSVYVSFDDGDHWQSLRLNLPATSIRDLVIHNDDIVVGTHGRSFWILDDITPLRQLNEKSSHANAVLFAPQLTYRVRSTNYPDTPLPPEFPAGQNPPDGAILDYVLKASSSTPVVLEVADEKGNLIRRFSSADKPEPVNPDDLNVPMYWVRADRTLPAEPDMHRFIWDLRYPPPDALDHDYPISAIPHDTVAEPRGPLVLPGRYTVKLTADGKTYSQPLTINMDPRVKLTADSLRRQLDLSLKITDAMHRDYVAIQQVRSLRDQIKKLQTSSPPPELADLDKKLADLQGSSGGFGMMFLSSPPGRSLERLNSGLSDLLGIVDGADAAPTTQAVKMFGDVSKALDEQLAQLKQLTDKDVPDLNKKLKQSGSPPLNLESLATPERDVEAAEKSRDEE